MFTLRFVIETRENESQKFEEQVENHELGNSYSKVKSGTKLFDEIMDEDYPEFSKDDIEAIITGENGLSFFICKSTNNKQLSHFIMSENGKTFEKL